jgi:integrase
MKTVQPIRDKEQLEQLKLVLMRQSYRDWVMFMMGIGTGLRIMQLIELKVKDVRGKVHIVPDDETKQFLIPHTLRNIINEYTNGMNDDDWLLPSQKGGHITRVQAYRLLNKAAAKLGMDEIGTHTMRKTFGYHFYKDTKDVATLQEIFGHSAPSVTLRYIGVDKDIMDEALADFSL